VQRIPASPQRTDSYNIMVEPRPAGTTLGLYRGLPIAERVVDLFDRRFTFVGVIGRQSDGQYDVNALKPGQFVVEPGLVYDLEAGDGQERLEVHPGPPAEVESQKSEDRRVLIQVSATLALFLAGGFAVQLILRLFHLG
jgi:hypothetical protein